MSTGAGWPIFLIARWRLALAGHLPLRLISFLRDAHQRGVLRQAGGSYEFRHDRLREFLISVDAGGSAPGSAPGYARTAPSGAPGMLADHGQEPGPA
jgi:hypothetical protein